MEMEQDEDDDNLMYLSAGPLAALFLGMALVPLRGLTTASNLTFVFMALTIVVAEFGGRRAAVATALCSALSLDFFLTQPYLRLAIADKHDLIAFLGLTVCGLVAAALGAQRGQRVSDLRAARQHLALLHSALAEGERTLPVETSLTKILEACRAVLPLAAVAVRDARGQLLAASGETAAVPVVEAVLTPDTLLLPGSPDEDQARRGPPLPGKGARLALRVPERQLGWLEVWGNGAPASAQARRTLADVARVLAVLLAGPSPSPGPRSGAS